MSEIVAARTPSYSRIELATVTSRAQANLLGNIHGGEVVKLADSAAGIVAQRHSGGPAVTAALDEMAFLEPVRVGDIVRTFAQINWVGSSSMEIGVRIETQPWDEATVLRHVGSAYFVFVAIDGAGAARPVPELEPENDDDRRRMREAGIRRAHRLARRQEIDAARLTP
ncbi:MULTISPECIES: acyl-CoA thioesterase [unclassified Nocardioides]|uniref:acyl-CoA thioesterase n=1 Tax=unclassified Nocardioides TaxID=2615069 RepID=UPI0006F72CA3|nr:MULTISPECIES: acyl-CoA thioesterase [unclassified Nocardioides]KRA31457.1 acyl-CoA thioesterase [Nocardioides sp. Root614]KRA88077.1 acyl-CoA thioesterase [Nocardioides sp. Root682]